MQGALLTPTNGDRPDTLLFTYGVARGSRTRLSKLVVMLSYSREAIRTLLNDMDFTLLRRVQTTQMTPYPENKMHRGLSKLILREQKQDEYRLVYQSKRLLEGPVQQIFETWRTAERKRLGDEWEDVT